MVLAALRATVFTVTDMSGDEMAKLHVRYMVGGHARGLAHELLYRFGFPERPGALLGFLQAIGSRWNISLFHYRNHGSDHGRVLARIQASPPERADFLDPTRCTTPTWRRRRTRRTACSSARDPVQSFEQSHAATGRCPLSCACASIRCPRPGRIRSII